MINIIKNDFYKLYKTYSIYIIMFAINILSIILSLYMYKKGIITSEKEIFILFENIAFYNLILFIIVYFGGYISDEYGNGTIKLSLIYSITRNEFIISKFIIFFINAIIMLSLNLIIGFISTLCLCKNMIHGILPIIIYNYILIIPLMALAIIGLIISISLDKSAYVAYIFLAIYIVSKLFLDKLGIINIVNDLSIDILEKNEFHIIFISIIYIIIGLIISLILFNKKSIN
ncbi:ABC transporter permease [Clostridium massiliamazoniense]|uniref:ABC transporter permease n=1 Tax=Clostridium massiliamazoniense TaxID=1347366 RepID=UPI0006D7843D|nr:ABC transporter permease [Clostridium massiliamazoniense]